MANGEGGNLFEEVVALLRWVIVGEKEAIDSAKKIERASRSAQKPIKSFNAELARMAKEADPKLLQRYAEGWKTTNMEAGRAASALKKAGKSTAEVQSILTDAGYSQKELNEALGESERAWDRVIKSIRWATYRFFTTLIVYQLLRGAVRGVNDAIQDAIRLFREFNVEQRKFNAILSLNKQIVSDFLGDTAEWAKVVEELGDKYGYATAKILEVARSIGRANMILKLNDKQLEDVIDMVVNYGKQLGYTGEELPKFAEAFADAVEGSTKTWEQLAAVPMGDEYIEQWWRMAAGVKESTEEATRYVLSNLSEQEQAQLRYLYVAEQITNRQVEMAYAPATAAAEVTELLRTEYEEQQAIAGETAQVFTQLGLQMKIFFSGIIADFSQVVIDAAANMRRLLGFIQALIGELRIPRAEWEDPGAIWERVTEEAWAWRATFEPAADELEEISEISKEAAESLGDFGKQAALIIPKVDASTSAISNLADQLLNVILRARQAQEEAYEKYIDSLDKLNKDEIDRREDIEENYADKAADLRGRAAQRIENARNKAARREKDDRADLLLHLKHMEENYLLDVLQMRREYQMDLEDAARTRDAVAIRRLQRQYALQRKEREEDYQLDRRQYIERWKLRHKQNQEALREEIRQIRENLAKELAELRAAKQKDLEELRENYAERRQELQNQYEKQLTDLKQSNAEQLAKILAKAVAEGEITKPRAEEITKFLADEYGYREEDITNFVNYYLEEMARLETGVVAAAAAIASAIQAAAGVSKTPIGFAKIAGMAGTPGFAEGGTFVTSGPTPILVGERGPELVNVIPLAKGGSVVGGLRSQSMDIRLTVDGTQSGAWSGDFETQVLRIFRGVLQESL